MDIKEQVLRRKLAAILPLMNEKQRRAIAAAEAQSYGRGGIRTVARIAGMSRQTIYRGLSDLETSAVSQRIRDPGGGRKRLSEHQPDLMKKLEAVLHQDGQQVSYHSVANLLHELDYSLQGNRKGSEGVVDHLQRDAQFRYINDQAALFLRRRVPIISVDTKKKELVGAYKNAGREWRPKGDAIEVPTHDFPDPRVPKAVPYGVYDIGYNSGWVNAGMPADKAQFAMESVRQWRKHMGQARYRGRAVC